MSAYTLHIEAEKQAVLISIEKGDIPCFIKEGDEKTPTIQFLRATQDSEVSFTPANDAQVTAINELIEDGELVVSPLKTRHFDQSYRVIVPPPKPKA